MNPLVLLIGLAQPAEGPVLAPRDPAAAFLRATSPLERERARRVLIGRGEDAVPVFRQGLRSEDPRVREGSLDALARLGTSDVLPQIAAAARDPVSAVRSAALVALAEIGPDPLPGEALHAARDPEWTVRVAAAELFARSEAPAATDALRELALDPDPDVRGVALEGLIRSPAAGADRALIERFDALDPERRLRALWRLVRDPSDEARELFGRLAHREDPPDAGGHAGPAERALAALGLRRLGDDVLAGPLADLLLSSAASTDPRTRRAAIECLVYDRERAARLVLEALPDARSPAESFARLAVGLVGPAARAPLLSIAAGERPATAEAVAGAIAALRSFRTPETTEALAWVYGTDLPRRTREELCAAFEDLPKSPGARSGLLAALMDPDSTIRVRAFRVLLEFGASTADEIRWLVDRVREEREPFVERRMARLLAAHATGDGARELAALQLRRLDDPTQRDDALDVLENLRPGPTHEAVARAIGSRMKDAVDARVLRLLTRLEGETADRLAARRIEQAIAQGERDVLLGALVALRTGGGPRCLAAVRAALDLADPDLANEAARTLVRRGDAVALDAVARRFASYDPEMRRELVMLARFPDRDAAGAWLGGRIADETNPEVLEILLERVGELGCPLVGTLIAQTRDDVRLTLRVRAIEALGRIGGEEAVSRLAEILGEFEDGTRPAVEDPDRRLVLESALRAIGRSGRAAFASLLAGHLFSRVAALERSLYDTDAAFAFESTVIRAILDLAASSGSPRDVSAAVEQEIFRRAESGDLFLFPKALFLRLADATKDAPSAFRPLHAELHRLALRLPPYGDRRELMSAVRLAELSAAEGDHAAAALHLSYAVSLIDDKRIDGARILKEHYGPPDPLIGRDPVLRLRAELEMARARASEVADPTRAIAHYRKACSIAERDAWVHVVVAGGLMSKGIDRAEAAALSRRAAALAPHDGELLIRAARVLGGCGDGSGFDEVFSDYLALVDCGLQEDRALHRVAAAEALVRLGRERQAMDQVERALEIDARARAAVENDPMLAPLLRR